MSEIVHDPMIQTYLNIFREKPSSLISAPGRINLIGEHTDYSNGFVLPVAIDLAISIAMRPREDSIVRVYSMDFDEKKEIDLTSFNKDGEGWIEYIKGIAWILKEEGYSLKGWDGVISGTIPVGAGLSSSAALEIAALKAFSVPNNLDLSPTQMAVLGRKAEIGWVGVNVGIMDQLISAGGKAGHAVLLDCQSLEFEYISIPPDIQFVVMDTMTRRKLSSSDYNTRHDEVYLAAEFLGVSTLREASLRSLKEASEIMDPILYRRAMHVITENERVLSFCDAMRSGDQTIMGQLINQSHASLRDDFEVSSDALNTMVEIAQKQPNCLGARMTGAGFGGCALALIIGEDVNVFIKDVKETYATKMGLVPNIFKVQSNNGVSIRIVN